MTQHINLPGPWADAVDAACDLDRAYFNAHPDATWYVRKRQPHEYEPYDAEMPRKLTHTLVRQFGPGVRQRSAITAAEALELACIRAEGMDVIFPENDVTRGLAKVARHLRNNPNAK